jgi:hypothetical protein
VLRLPADGADESWVWFRGGGVGLDDGGDGQGSCFWGGHGGLV